MNITPDGGHGGNVNDLPLMVRLRNHRGRATVNETEAAAEIERLRAALAWIVENCPLPLTPTRDFQRESRYAAIEKMVAEKAGEQ